MHTFAKYRPYWCKGNEDTNKLVLSDTSSKIQQTHTKSLGKLAFTWFGELVHSYSCMIHPVLTPLGRPL